MVTQEKTLHGGKDRIAHECRIPLQPEGSTDYNQGVKNNEEITSVAVQAIDIPNLSLVKGTGSFWLTAKNPWEFIDQAKQLTEYTFTKLLSDKLRGEARYREKTDNQFAELACRLLKDIQTYKGPHVTKEEQENFDETGKEPRYLQYFHDALPGEVSDLFGDCCYFFGYYLPAEVNEAYQNFMKEDLDVREGVIQRYIKWEAGKVLVKQWAELEGAKSLKASETAKPVKPLPDPVPNLQYVFGFLFDEISTRAEKALTLDERIEAFRKWSCTENQEDLDDMLRMQRERDTEDYSEPGTWYGCIRKWQAMTEEEALASFRTDWYEWGDGIRRQRHSPKILKDFYAFLKQHSLPPLTEQEKKDMYDRRIEPVCLVALFKEMDNAGFTHVFEDTYDYSHSEPCVVCKDDFDEIRDALNDIRGDALEAFIQTAFQVLAEQKTQQEILKTDLIKKEWPLNTPKTALELAERALLSQSPAERLAVMLQYVADHPDEVEKQEDYIKLLQRLVNEQNGDYSDPVTSWGCLIHFRQMTEDEFVEKLKSMPLHWNKGYMPEEERREAHQRMMEVVIPELPEEEQAVLYLSGSTSSSSTPLLRKLFVEDLKEPAGELLFEYCGERGNYDAFEVPEWIAENALECLMGLHPDVQQMVLKTAGKLLR